MSHNRGRKFHIEALSDNEVQRLIRACSHRAPTGLRNRALIVTLYRGGLRISEAVFLQSKDLDPSSGAIRVLNGKGGKARTVGIDAGTFAVIDRWLDVRSTLGVPNRSPVLCTLKGGRLSTAYIRKLLPRLAHKAGIEKRVHAHGLRHTHAAQLAAEGIPINVISKQLGHSNIATTSRYLDHIAPQQVIEAISKRSWVVDTG